MHFLCPFRGCQNEGRVGRTMSLQQTPAVLAFSFSALYFIRTCSLKLVKVWLTGMDSFRSNFQLPSHSSYQTRYFLKGQALEDCSSWTPQQGRWALLLPQSLSTQPCFQKINSSCFRLFSIDGGPFLINTILSSSGPKGADSSIVHLTNFVFLHLKVFFSCHMLQPDA